MQPVCGSNSGTWLQEVTSNGITPQLRVRNQHLLSGCRPPGRAPAQRALRRKEVPHPLGKQPPIQLRSRPLPLSTQLARWPERTRDSAASQRLSGPGLLHAPQRPWDSGHPPTRPGLQAPAARSPGAGKPKPGSEGWRRSRGGSRPGGGSGRSRSPARGPGRKEASSRRGRVLSLSPPRDPEPPTNSARRPRAPASVPGRACGRAG